MRNRTAALTFAAGHILTISGAFAASVAGPSTSQSPYMVASDPASGVSFISIASNGNGTLSPNELYINANTGLPTYRLVGIVDGMGAFRSPEDVQNGTFSLLVNHELGGSSGIVRAHGNRGAFVSQWTIRADGNNLEVLGAKDLIRTVKLWNVSTNAYTTWNSTTPMLAYSNNVYGGANPSFNGFERFCSADMAEPGAFRFADFGTDARILTNGEEAGAPGRAFAHIASGDEAGTSYELHTFGDYSWENLVFSPHPQMKTIGIGLDDETPGNIYVHIGTKQNAGNVVERAGIENAATWLVGMNDTTVVAGQRVEDRTWVLGNASTGRVESKRFFLTNLGNLSNTTGSQLQSMGDQMGQMNWLRPEDGCWDTQSPNDFYFVTTDSFNGNSRLWQMRFDDIENPEAGGVVTMLLDGSNLAGTTSAFSSATGLTDARMFDNMCINRHGQIFLQEDVGNNPRLGRLWMYDLATDTMTEIGVPDSNRFLVGASTFMTQDEETSGIIDAHDILGDGWFLQNMQAHYNISGELVQGGQLMAIFIPAAASTCPGDANGDGVVNFDDLNLVLSDFGRSGIGLAGDVSRDGQVTFIDLNFVLSFFGGGC
ncbi:MAG: hypothetical protein AB7G17_04040 [Phycisphaerales bacterium]